MSYIGNTPTQQNFVAGADQFSGNGSTVAFTLSRSVNTVFDIFVTVSNVPQDPFTAYTVSGNTLTFDSAPPSGTNNIDVVYRATNVQTFVPSPGVSTQLGLGSASAPSLTFIGDTNTGIFSPAADTIAFTEGGVESMRIDTSGNVGIGTGTVRAQEHIFGLGQTTAALTDAGNRGGMLRVSDDNAFAGSGGAILFANSQGDVANSVGFAAIKGLLIDGSNNTAGSIAFSTRNASTDTALTERVRISYDGNFQFNSGYGSVATAYGCRAWVNFDGTSNTANLSGTYSQSGTTVTVTATAHGLIAGNVVYSDITTGTAVDGTYTVATVISSSQFTYTAGTSLTTSGNVTLRRNTIRASGNVSSVADNGTGDYTVNFSVAMPDANYAVAIPSMVTVTNLSQYFSVYVNSTNNGYVSKTTSAVRLGVYNTLTANQDVFDANVVIFR